MGACSSNASVSAPVNADHSREIDRAMQSILKKDENDAVKLILLGGGDSGKTTFRKQLRFIYGDSKEISRDELEEHKLSIVKNCVDGLNALLDAAKLRFPELTIPSEHRDTVDELELLSVEDEIGSEDVFTSEFASRVQGLWGLRLLQQTFKERDKLALDKVNLNFDSVSKLMADCEAIFVHDYVPTRQHILYARRQTIDISEESFVVNGATFTVTDVGGQRNERKKWLSLFEGMTGFVFFASLSEYDQYLAEDRSRNRMHESLSIYEAIVNFVNSDQPPPMLLFLNKKDLLQEKIDKVGLNVCFEDFDGPNNFDGAVEFIKAKYEKRNKPPQLRKVHMYVTCATDSENIQLVFNSCAEIILEQNLSAFGLAGGV